MNHVKPTSEELDANANAALEEAEKLNNQPPAPPTLPVSDPEPPKEDKPEETADPEDKEEETAPPEDKEEDKDGEEDVDYKRKFTESTREALVLHAQKKQMDDAVEKAAALPEPTEDEIKTEYPDFDLMTDTEKKLAKDNMINKRRFEYIHAASQAGKDQEQWIEKVDGFIQDPKTLADNPELEGKTDEFKVFASRPTRRGLNFQDLVLAFLGERSKLSAKHKGKMFETGSGGPNEKNKPKSDKISIEEGKRLRLTDYKKYTELLKAGKIEYENV